MGKNFFIHIGNHKTGTTAIQKFLNSYAEQLKSNGIEYPTIGYTNQYPYNNHNIAWELNDDIRFNSKSKALSDLYNFMSYCNNNIIISSEDFQNLEFDTIKFNEFLNEIKKNKFDIKIILYLRNQIDYFAGVYQIFLLLGYPVNNIESLYKSLEQNDYIQLKFPLKVKFWFDYKKQINKVKKIFNVENKDIICKSYDENKNRLLKGFTEIINVSSGNFDYEKFNKVNESITVLSKSMLEFFNLSYKKFNLTAKDAIKIRAILTNKDIFKGEKFIMEDKKLKDFMIRRFKESNNAVEAEFNISINNFLLMRA